jgi:hypothetical protein
MHVALVPDHQRGPSDWTISMDKSEFVLEHGDLTLEATYIRPHNSTECPWVLNPPMCTIPAEYNSEDYWTIAEALTRRADADKSEPYCLNVEQAWQYLEATHGVTREDL